MDQRFPITPLLEQVHDGDPRALDRLAREVHEELIRLAARLLARRAQARQSVTLDPEALVNETYVRLLQQRKRWQNRGHFFAIVTRIMVRVLSDHRRARGQEKRAGLHRTSLGALDRQPASRRRTAEVPLLTHTLQQLEQLDARAARIARLRILWGLENDEIAQVLGVSRSTFDREWRFARAWIAERC